MHMADPQLTMVDLLVRPVLLPRERLPQIEINSIENTTQNILPDGSHSYEIVVPASVGSSPANFADAFEN